MKDKERLVNGVVVEKKERSIRKERLVNGLGIFVMLGASGVIGWKLHEGWPIGPAPITRSADGFVPPPTNILVTRQDVDSAVATAVAKALGSTTAKEPTRVVSAAPVVTATITATVAPTATVKLDATPASVKGVLVSAERSGSGWVLQHPDGDKTEVRQLPDGFTPDRSLRFATDIKSLEIGSDLKIYSDWETALNTKRAEGALAGYNYDYNDFCPTGDFKCNVQGDMYGWRTFQGDFVEVPGIGRLEGGPRRSVVLSVLNLDGSVNAWDNEKNGQVTVKRGFTATGRIFDGQKNVDVLEKNLSGHWAFRQVFGTPEKSYIGITDSPDNALEVLMVSVQRKQWGNNPDGSKRMEFQLIRAEVIKAK